jgi:hypothetical protein
MIELLFSFPVISCLLATASALFAVSVVVRFIPDKRKLDQIMFQVEMALTRCRDAIAEKEAAIAALRVNVEKLKPVQQHLDRYQEQLTQLRVDMERQQLAEDGRTSAEEDDDDGFGRRRRFKL